MSEEIHNLVDQLLANNLDSPPEDLKLHLTALLEARSRNVTTNPVVKSVNKRDKKSERKEVNYN